MAGDGLDDDIGNFQRLVLELDPGDFDLFVGFMNWYLDSAKASGLLAAADVSKKGRELRAFIARGGLPLMERLVGVVAKPDPPRTDRIGEPARQMSYIRAVELLKVLGAPVLEPSTFSRGADGLLHDLNNIPRSLDNWVNRQLELQREERARRSKTFLGRVWNKIEDWT